MQIDSHSLIQELLQITEEATDSVRRLRNLSEAELNFKEHPDKWSILECIEHLNRYGDFYLPELQKAVSTHKISEQHPTYKPGLIGNYFAKLMKVTNGKMTRMPSPPDKNPAGSKLTVITIDRFLKQQEMLASLLRQGRDSDLTRSKVPISLTSLIRLRLGDTFRFFVYHIERHVLQALRVEQSMKERQSIGSEYKR